MNPTLSLASILGLVLATALAGGGPPAPDLESPTRDYYVYVCSESEDEVALVRFGPGGLEVQRKIEVGTFPAEIEGPHGIRVAPDGRSWYVSMSHGLPFGSIHKFETGTDEWIESVKVGMFPATLDVASATGLLFVVNSDFYGDHVPSTISVVETGTMTEVASIATGVMPHGGRLSADGRRFYSVNMMDDELVEVDALRFEVARRLPLTLSDETAPSDTGHHPSGHETVPAAGHISKVEPSWASEPTRSGKVYVAALTGNAILEIDLEKWRISRRFKTPAGPYNLAVSPDERLLVVAYKKSDAVGFWDLEHGVEIAALPTSRRIPHGVAITADGRFSFVTVEGVGGEPGVVEVYDNRVPARVATLDVGKQAGGIALWEPGG